MSPAERRALLQRRVPVAGPGIDIGGEAVGRRVARAAARLLAVAALAGVFVATFYRFTSSWRVATIVVALMAAWMLVVGRVVEGRADRID